MRTSTSLALLVALTSATAWGCGSSGSSNGPDATTAATRTSLHRAQNCGDLLTDLKGDAVFKLNLSTDQQIQAIQQCIAAYGDQNCAYYGGYYGYGYGYGADKSAPQAEDASGTATGAGAPPPSVPGSSNSSASSYSQTNVQVAGVDEADIVKNDGQNIYVLHGNALKVVKAWPADQLAESESLTIEGVPNEMFVANGKAVVYSQVNGADLYPAAGVPVKKQYTENYYPTGVAYAGGGADVGVAEPGAPDVPPGPGGTTPVQQYVPLTKITVVDLAGGQPAVTREVWFEGNYLDSRRVDNHVRTVLQSYAYGPTLDWSIGYQDASGNWVSPQTGSAMINALNALRAKNVAAIDATTLADWLPFTFTKDGAGTHASTIACEDFYIPTVGSTEAGMTEVAAIDLSAPDAAPRQTGILGAVDTVYGNASTLYLASHAWVEPPIAWACPIAYASGGSTGSAGVATGTASPPPETTASPPAPAPDPAPAPGGKGTGKQAGQAKSIHTMNTPAGVTTSDGVVAWSTGSTHIHKFELTTDASFPNYVASGTVSGNIKDQYSLDELDGNLRIATTEQINYIDGNGQWVTPSVPEPDANGNVPPADLNQPSSVNHVRVLAQNGPWLEVIGDVGPLAPSESIQSVRFVGTRGYVTTYRRIDPLFAIDLGNPSAPTILGALTIPGFSEYMHPIDATHLLTIGRDSDPSTGISRGLKLSIYDVSNGAAPSVVQNFVYDGSEYGSSDAEYDPKAFTYFDDKKLLAFPYFSYSSNFDGGMKSTLELFQVDASAGFDKVGAIDASALQQSAPQGYCGGWYGPSVRRGLFLENVAYAVTYAGIIAKDTSNMAAAGTSLALEPPTADPMMGGYGAPMCAVDDATGKAE